MKFHPQKYSALQLTRSESTKLFNYQLHGHTLKTETDSKYLGVMISNKLSWNNHINNICSKAMGEVSAKQEPEPCCPGVLPPVWSKTEDRSVKASDDIKNEAGIIQTGNGTITIIKPEAKL